MRERIQALFCTLIALFFIAGCAGIERANGQKYPQAAHWDGRLSVRTLPTATELSGAGSAFQAAFELRGSVQEGDLRLFTPLGSTAAWIQWNAQGAQLIASNETRQFGSLEQLVQQAIGTELPVAALFAWLRGQPQDVDGWQVDLQGFGQGKITARRSTPEPATELRLVLNLSQ